MRQLVQAKASVDDIRQGCVRQRVRREVHVVHHGPYPHVDVILIHAMAVYYHEHGHVVIHHGSIRYQIHRHREVFILPQR